MVQRFSPHHHTGDVTPTFEGARPSAVLVVLADGAHGAEVLLTRRSQRLSNHRGEVSFPGGRLDEGETYEQAALREAHEEVGLSPAHVIVHGRLQPIATLVSKSWIVPVLATAAERHALTPHAHEVDRAFWHPLVDLTAPGTYREERWVRESTEWRVAFFDTDDETIWGATARMLHQLLCIASGVPVRAVGS